MSDQSEKEIQFLPPLDTESSSPVIKSQLQQLNQIQKEVEIIYEETKELGQQNDFRSDDSELSNTEVSQKIDDLNIRLEHLKRLEGYHD
ncbi:hypothetical protein [Thiomicrorhabdus sp.]|uniref:hypothetical protein n=1 Tax=Thiomicrorhabdus sp. TaxID=2039724 RepID=UPI0029C6E369|nr:hypothetical protein [Thiomicrorhabdus sp.]